MKRNLWTGLTLLLLFLAAILAIWKPWAPSAPKIHLGLDLQGGLSIILQTKTAHPTKDDLEKARTVLENRINGLGVAEPLIQIVGNNRIDVELPGLSPADQAKALKLIGERAVLQFRLVKPGAQGLTEADINQELRSNPNLNRAELEKQLMPLSDLGPPLLTGADLANAQVIFDPVSGQPEVSLTFTPKGAQLFAQITQQNVGRQLAIVLDGVVYTAPVIESVIPNGKAVINGLSGLRQASDIALVLRSGALPVALSIQEVQAIGPTLGQDAITAGIRAAIVGSLAIFVLIFFYYGDRKSVV